MPETGLLLRGRVATALVNIQFAACTLAADRSLFRAVRRGVILTGLVFLLAACGGGQSTSRTAANTAGGSTGRAVGSIPLQTSSASIGLPSGSRVLLDTTEPVSQSLAGAGSLYFTETIPAEQHTAEIYELIRIRTNSGRVAATRRFATAFDHALVAGGSLWVTTSNESQTNQTTLWRLDPRSLALQSHVNLPSASHAEGQTGSLAVADGHLWVGTGTLDRVSLGSGHVDRVVDLRYRGSVQVAADPSGRILLASLGYEHPTYIARLNPRTGTVLSHVTAPRSLSQPSIGGIVDGGAWIDNTLGARSAAWRLNVTNLKPVPSSGWAIPSSRIRAQVINGMLWVTELDGQENLNYCADPATGRVRARVAVLPGDSVLLTADGTSIFYSYVPINARSAKLVRAPISRGCTA